MKCYLGEQCPALWFPDDVGDHHDALMACHSREYRDLVELAVYDGIPKKRGIVKKFAANLDCRFVLGNYVALMAFRLRNVRNLGFFGMKGLEDQLSTRGFQGEGTMSAQLPATLKNDWSFPTGMERSFSRIWVVGCPGFVE